MRVTLYPPSELLAPYLQSFTVVESHEPQTRTLVPDACIVVGFRYAGAAALVRGDTRQELPNATFTGLRDQARCMCTAADSGVLLARFRAGAAAAFFQRPLHTTFGSALALEALAPAPEVRRTIEAVTGAADDAARIAVLERFLLERLRSVAHDALVSSALRAIEREPVSTRVGVLARQLGISCDRLEKRFRRVVGASPKRFARILRLRRSVDLYPSASNLTELAIAAGYCDQSHFIREFRAFTGEPPSRFFGSVPYC
ncbi:MAG TPA: helix-turn-helix domain-containing protein [Polyangiaceae bacterium]|nr:helix-turn-helix domain-containing protein [Polyangiaceae bacterium]